MSCQMKTALMLSNTLVYVYLIPLPHLTSMIRLGSKEVEYMSGK